MKNISDILGDIEKLFDSDDINLGLLINAFQERCSGVFMFLFSLPAALPLPAVGYGTVLGLPLLLLSIQQIIGYRKIWLPDSWKNKSIKYKSYKNLSDSAMPWIKRIEYIIKPRLGFLTSGIFLKINGVLLLVMSLSVCIPLPLTNTVPSLGIALISIGIIARDGLAVIAGALIGISWIIALVFIVTFLGTEGIVIFKDFIKEHIF